jgi:hypothetical protein
LDYEAGVELKPGMPVRRLRFRMVTESAGASIALLNVDENPAAWRVELPAGLFQDIRRDFGSP